MYKVRTRRKGAGKSGGYRTLLAYKEMDKAIFIYGFSKTEKDNIDQDELAALKRLAKDLLKIDIKEYERQIELGNFNQLEE